MTGTHELSPHQANIVAAFIAVRKTAMRIGNFAPVALDAPNAPDAPSFCRDHISGSFTLRRIHNVKIAGTMPVKNTARHPNRGNTIATTIAARP